MLDTIYQQQLQNVKDCPAEVIRQLENVNLEENTSLYGEVQTLLEEAHQSLEKNKTKLEADLQGVLKDFTKSEDEVLSKLEALANNTCVYVTPEDRPSDLLERINILKSSDRWDNWRIDRLMEYTNKLTNPGSEHLFPDKWMRLKSLRSNITDKALRFMQTSHPQYEEIKRAYEQVNDEYQKLVRIGQGIDSRTLNNDYVPSIKYFEDQISKGIKGGALPNQDLSDDRYYVYQEELKKVHDEYATYTLKIATDKFNLAVTSGTLSGRVRAPSIQEWLQKPHDRIFSDNLSLGEIRTNLQTGLANLKPSKANELGVKLENDRSIEPTNVYLTESIKPVFNKATEAIEQALLLVEKILTYWKSDPAQRKLPEVYEHVYPHYQSREVLNWIDTKEKNEIDKVEQEISKWEHEIGAVSKSDIEGIRRNISDTPLASPYAPSSHESKLNTWKQRTDQLEKRMRERDNDRSTMNRLLSEVETSIDNLGDTPQREQRQSIKDKLNDIASELEAKKDFYTDGQRTKYRSAATRLSGLDTKAERLGEVFRNFWKESYKNIYEIYQKDYKDNDGVDGDEGIIPLALWNYAAAYTKLDEAKQLPVREIGGEFQHNGRIRLCEQHLKIAIGILSNHEANEKRPSTLSWDKDWGDYTLNLCKDLDNECKKYKLKIQAVINSEKRLTPYRSQLDKLLGSQAEYCEQDWQGFIDSIDNDKDIEDQDRKRIIDNKFNTSLRKSAESALRQYLTSPNESKQCLPKIEWAVGYLQKCNYPINVNLLNEVYKGIAPERNNEYLKKFNDSLRDEYLSVPTTLSIADYDRWVELIEHLEGNPNDLIVYQGEVATYACLRQLYEELKVKGGGHLIEPEDAINKLQNYCNREPRDLYYKQYKLNKLILLDAYLNALRLSIWDKLTRDQNSQKLLSKMYNVKKDIQSQSQNMIGIIISSAWDDLTNVLDQFSELNYSQCIRSFEQIKELKLTEDSNTKFVSYRIGDLEKFKSNVYFRIMTGLNNIIGQNIHNLRFVSNDTKFSLLEAVLVNHYISQQIKGALPFDFPTILQSLLVYSDNILNCIDVRYNQILQKTVYTSIDEEYRNIATFSAQLETIQKQLAGYNALPFYQKLESQVDNVNGLGYRIKALKDEFEKLQKNIDATIRAGLRTDIWNWVGVHNAENAVAQKRLEISPTLTFTEYNDLKQVITKIKTEIQALNEKKNHLSIWSGANRNPPEKYRDLQNIVDYIQTIEKKCDESIQQYNQEYPQFKTQLASPIPMNPIITINGKTYTRLSTLDELITASEEIYELVSNWDKSIKDYKDKESSFSTQLDELESWLSYMEELMKLMSNSYETCCELPESVFQIEHFINEFNPNQYPNMSYEDLESSLQQITKSTKEDFEKSDKNLSSLGNAPAFLRSWIEGQGIINANGERSTTPDSYNDRMVGVKKIECFKKKYDAYLAELYSNIKEIENEIKRHKKPSWMFWESPVNLTKQQNMKKGYEALINKLKGIRGE